MIGLLLISTHGYAEQSKKQTHHSPGTLTDYIIAVVYGPERNVIICKSELGRKGLDGRDRTLYDIIMDELFYQDALRYKMPLDETVIDKYLETIQRDSGMSLDGIKQIMKDAGYTYEEGRQQLRIMYAVSSIIDYKIRSRMVVTEKDVVAYYNDHPILKPAAIKLQRTVVPFDATVSREEQEAQILNAIKRNNWKQWSWTEPFWLNKDEISSQLAALKELPAGAMTEPNVMSDGFELYRVVERQAESRLPLDERYREISNTLRGPKFKELMEKYKAELLENANIVINDSQLQKEFDVHKNRPLTKESF
jgi:hypothetical protein